MGFLRRLVQYFDSHSKQRICARYAFFILIDISACNYKKTSNMNRKPFNPVVYSCWLIIRPALIISQKKKFKERERSFPFFLLSRLFCLLGFLYADERVVFETDFFESFVCPFVCIPLCFVVHELPVFLHLPVMAVLMCHDERYPVVRCCL